MAQVYYKTVKLWATSLQRLLAICPKSRLPIAVWSHSFECTHPHEALTESRGIFISGNVSRFPHNWLTLKKSPPLAPFICWLLTRWRQEGGIVSPLLSYPNWFPFKMCMVLDARRIAINMLMPKVAVVQKAIGIPNKAYRHTLRKYYCVGCATMCDNVERMLWLGCIWI